MKNITLAVEEEVLDRVRVIAAERKTTVNALVREFLASIAAQEDRQARARRRLLELMERSNAEVGPITWSREDLYDR